MELNTIMVVGVVSGAELKQSSKGKMWTRFTLENGKNKIECKTFKEELAKHISGNEGKKVLVIGSINAEPFHNEQYNKDFINPYIDIATCTEFTEESVVNAIMHTESKKNETNAPQQVDFEKLEENTVPLADGEDLPF